MAEIVSLKILVGGVDLFDGLSELSMAIVDGRRCDVVLAICTLTTEQNLCWASG